MTYFIRVLDFSDKEAALSGFCNAFRSGTPSDACFSVEAESFKTLPGVVFAYWISESAKKAFSELRTFSNKGLNAQVGCSTKDDFRFLRTWWEDFSNNKKWVDLAKGGRFSKFYSDIHLKINWHKDAKELEAAILKKYPYLGESANWVLHRESSYGEPGITWTRRTKSDFSPRFLPAKCVFSEKGLSAFVEGGAHEDVAEFLAILSSSAVHSLIEVQLAAADKSQAGGVANTYEVGIIKSTPAPNVDPDSKKELAKLSRLSWSLKRKLDAIEENSHAFCLPIALVERIEECDTHSIEKKLTEIQIKIDNIVRNLYGFDEVDTANGIESSESSGSPGNEMVDEAEDSGDSEDEDGIIAVDLTDGLLCWAVGVAFGRFDWRLATGEREAPIEPDPFDPLPAKSPGMLPDGAAPFHAHGGILVDDKGNPHDLPQVIEEVLARVEAEVPGDLRRWLQRDFFPIHLKQYSKSRRKAPIYWPFATNSGSYTLWLYYPQLTSQTLYSAVNDFVEPKLTQISREADELRIKGAARSRDDEKAFEALQALELELIELRDTLLQIAPTYRPNHDDGVQITAAPLWQLFRHKPWQKVLKDTWAKLEKGEYDWAHLAMAYWPDRVREKCKTDKSLAIAHDLEHLYVEPEPKPAKASGRKKRSGA